MEVYKAKRRTSCLAWLAIPLLLSFWCCAGPHMLVALLEP
jgi:hypothetical protein